MSNQLDIFGTPPSVHQRTSYESALQVKPTVEGNKEQIEAYIEGCGSYGATCDEVERALKLKHQTASARIRDLFLDNRIKDSGRKRKTRSGNPAAVWLKAETPLQPGPRAAGETSPPAGGPSKFGG